MPKTIMNDTKELICSYSKCLNFINVTNNEELQNFNFQIRSSRILRIHR